MPPSHEQQATFGLQLGFSQTNSHFGFGQTGLAHFQSHLGSSQTASHSGLGAFIKKNNLTMSNTMWHFAYCYTFWAIFSFTSFIRTFNLTFWFFTFNITNSISWLLTTSVTSTRSGNLLFYTRKQDHKLLDI